MKLSNKTPNQQPSFLLEKEKGSETISKESRVTLPETGDILTSKVEDEDIVQIQNERFQNFLNKANRKFNNQFDYYRFVFENAKTKGIIICKIHGEFLQNPDKHLQSVYGCPKCWTEIRSSVAKEFSKPFNASEARKLTKDEFLYKAEQKYGDTYKYDMDLYISSTLSKIKIFCPIHGDFMQTPYRHLQSKNKAGCPKCGMTQSKNSKIKPYDDFMNVANKIHKGFYTYSEENRSTYSSRKSKVKILCPIHGEFFKKAQKHISGQGCFRCKISNLIESNMLVGVYSHDLFETKPEMKNIPAKVYYLSVNYGEYHKIGITRKSIKKRIRGIKSKAKTYNYNIKSVSIELQKDFTLYDAFCFEQLVLARNSEHRVFTRWSTELFNIDIRGSFDEF